MCNVVGVAAAINRRRALFVHIQEKHRNRAANSPGATSGVCSKGCWDLLRIDGAFRLFLKQSGKVLFSSARAQSGTWGWRYGITAAAYPSGETA